MVDKMIDRQSMEFDQKKRKQLVWEIEKNWPRTSPGRCSTTAAPAPACTACEGHTVMLNGIYNGNRMETCAEQVMRKHQRDE